MYVPFGPWFAARFLSSQPLGLFLSQGVLLSPTAEASWRWLPCADTLMLVNRFTFFTMLPGTLWLADVASHWYVSPSCCPLSACFYSLSACLFSLSACLCSLSACLCSLSVVCVPFRHACVPVWYAVAGRRDLPLFTLIKCCIALSSLLPARPFPHPHFISSLPGFFPSLPSLHFVSASSPSPFFFSPVDLFFLQTSLHPTLLP